MKSKDDFRAGLSDLLERLTLGPLQSGERIESPPSDTYLTGILWPRGSPADPEDDDVISSGDNDDLHDDGVVPGYRAVKPCSIGVTFSAASNADVLVSLGTTARYRPELSDAAAHSQSEVDRSNLAQNHGVAWRHHRLGYQLRLDGGRTSGRWINNEYTREGARVEDLGVTLHVKRRAEGDLSTWTITLVNSSPESADLGLRDESFLFQSQIVVEVLGGTRILPRKQAKATSTDADHLSNQLIYRKVKEHAAGHGIAVSWDEDDPSGVASVRTTWLPRQVVEATDPKGHSSLASLVEAYPSIFRADWLASSAKDEVVAALRFLSGCYEKWIKTSVEGRVEEFHGDADLMEAAEGNSRRCWIAARRLRDGVECLATNRLAWRAFQMANHAMDRQSRFAVKGERAGPLLWRPFQLAYIVMAIPSLVDPAKWKEERECMDLLWFPTGGGKTEAYLGLTAFQILHRRLTSGTVRELGGVDVMMRYTLRLLTVQQFQRAAAVICACDLMRLEQPDKLGTAPINIGLYVGRDTTPNNMADAREALQREAQGEVPKSTPRQLLTCPICAGSISRRQYRPSPNESRLDITCDAPGCSSGGRPLPVLVVDECLYHSPPSLLIGTVDKFAQVPRNPAIGRLFGIGRGLPPGLIIQDELHLISGPLGSISGLYESAIDLLCTRDGIRPKIIGSTATIGRAEQQVRALFDRSVLQFPPPGIDADDSFFAVKQQPKEHDRLYIGISTAGRSPKFTLQAVLATLLESAQKLGQPEVSLDVKDPYWTCVAYFNSLRELGGAHVLVQDDVPRQMRFLAKRLQCPEPRLLLKNPVAELSGRIPSREIPEMLKRLEASLGADPMEEQPEDLVLASSMISVGVDVPRLGLMLVNGQPKSTSEYIQATSRIGRGLPGLVVTLYNFSRPRDLSHFEHFKTYHAALYRSVEATSVTPWSPRARDKALPAVLIGAVRQGVPGLLEAEAASKLEKGDVRVANIVRDLVRRCRVGSSGVEDEEAEAELQGILEYWEARAEDARMANRKLLYWERKSRFGNSSAHLLRPAEDAVEPSSMAWPAPGSMREVEPSAAFVLRRGHRGN